MADVRPPLTEQTLRETRDDLMGAVQDQRRAIGVPVPDEKTAAEFIDPILRKVEVEHERDRTRDLVAKPAPVPADVQTDEHGGAWWGEPGHSPRLPEGARPFQRQVGTARVGNGAAVYVPLKAADGTTIGARRAPAIEALKRRVKELKQIPEWRARLMTVLNANQPLEWKEKQYRALIAESVRLYGDPRKPTERKIVVH